MLRAARDGYAVMLDWDRLTADDLVAAIETAMTDEGMRDGMRRRHEMFVDQVVMRMMMMMMIMIMTIMMITMTRRSRRWRGPCGGWSTSSGTGGQGSSGLGPRGWPGGSTTYWTSTC